MKNKKDIENYSEKSKFLRKNGWEPWYHDDCWIKTEWIKQGKKYDYMGQSTEDAYDICKKLN